MRAFHWESRKARIWLDELPDWTYEVVEVIERHREVDSHGLAESRSVAVELFLPTGGRALYGGLGAVFVPKDTKRLTVQTFISHGEGKPYEEALAYRIDDVRRGLPYEFVEGIFDGVLQTDETQFLGAGTLSFRCAVHGYVGSSRSMFQRLSRIVVKLLLIKRDNVVEEDLMRILQLKPAIQ